MTLHHDENTLLKVRMTLVETGCSDTFALSCIESLQNAGILFREYALEDGETIAVTETTEAWLELEIAKDEEDIRTRALEFAVNSAVRGAGNVEALTARADLFVDYIKNGSSNG